MTRWERDRLKDDAELAALEEHILACGECAERADAAGDYVDAMRVAAIMLSEEGTFFDS